MRKMRLLTAMLLLLAMTLQGAIAPMAATFTDTADTKYEEAVDVLYALEIVNGMDEEKFAPNENLTRAEMTAIITRVLHMEDWEEERTPFTDVPEDHWAYYPITTAHSLGIINGVDSQNFMPDAPVTANQAIKMVVTLLGYQVQAEADGGYPAGYLLRAGQLDILKGMETGEMPLTRGDMACLIYRALDIPLMARLSFGDDADYIYKADTAATLLSAYMHIEKVKGVITAGYTEEISTPARILKKGEIAFENGEIYLVGESDAASMVGEKAELYVKKEENDTKVVLAALSKAEVTIIPAEGIFGNTTRETLVFDKNGKEEKVNINGASVLWNGSIKPDYTALTLQPDTGHIKLIYNAGTLETVMVESYENYLVNAVNKKEEKIDLAENRIGKKSIDLKDDAATYFTNAEGEEITAEKCSVENVLSIAESETGKFRKMILCTAKAEGVLSEISQDTVVLDENTYTLSESFTKAPRFSLPELGASASFLLNFCGQIAGVSQNKNADMLYGWLRSADVTKGLNGQPRLKIFTQSGKMQVFETLETVSLNGEPMKATGLLPQNGNEIFDGSNAIEQLIMFRVREEKISAVNTAMDYTASLNDDSRFDLFSKDVVLDGKCKQVINGVAGYAINYFGGTKGTFGRDWMARKGETVVFVLPGSGEDKDFSVKAGDSFKHYTDAGDLNLYNDIMMYDITEDFVISAIVWDRRDEGVSKNEYPGQDANMAIVTKNVLTVNEDGETVRKLSLISHAGSAFSRTVEVDFPVLFEEASTNLKEDAAAILKDGVKVRPESITVDMLDIGDIIQYESGADSSFTKLSVLFRAKTPGRYEQKSFDGARWITTEGANYGARILSYGVVERVASQGLIAKVNLLKAGEYVKNSGYHPTADDAVKGEVSTVMIYPSTILKCDLEKGTITTITKEDISVGDKALFVSRLTTPRMIIVYK